MGVCQGMKEEQRSSSGHTVETRKRVYIWLEHRVSWANRERWNSVGTSRL